jgi:RHS repeat-associated protein
VEERVEGVSGVNRQYVWGVRDRWDLVRRKRSTSGTLDETLYVLKDYLDPVAVVDGTGALVERYAYDAFGAVRFLAPDYSSRSSSSYAWDFLFHAEFQDQDTKFYNYGFRYYSTSLGRWLSRDPIENPIFAIQGISLSSDDNFGITFAVFTDVSTFEPALFGNIYVFVGNNAIYITDAYGLISYGDASKVFTFALAGIPPQYRAVLSRCHKTPPGCRNGCGWIGIEASFLAQAAYATCNVAGNPFARFAPCKAAMIATVKKINEMDKQCRKACDTEKCCEGRVGYGDPTQFTLTFD